jgi:hypothetical protein
MDTSGKIVFGEDGEDSLDFQFGQSSKYRLADCYFITEMIKRNP